MTQHREKLSAIIDGENLTDDIMDQLKQDDQQAAAWQSYHLISDVMNNEVSSHIDLDFTSKVAAALDDEPAILAPRVEKTWRDRLTQVTGGVAALMQQGGQFAIAATVTAAVIFGVQQYNQPLEATTDKSVNSVIPMAINTGVSPVSSEIVRPVDRNALIQQKQQQINAYLLDHQHQLRLQAAQTQQQDPEKSKDAKQDKNH